MRKLSFMLAAALLLGISVNANATEPATTAKQLTEKISQLLDNNSLVVEGDVMLQVRFTLNQKNEIVVLSVQTEDEATERFVKARLNYERVDLLENGEGKVYTVPIRITA